MLKQMISEQGEGASAYYQNLAEESKNSDSDSEDNNRLSHVWISPKLHVELSVKPSEEKF